ncbi:MAG: hypothetical protein RMK74_06010 [Myxococcales bacterium]|nr:hypothetical protein [Myxococcales bacterium]
MRADAHVSVATADVRGHRLARDAVLRLEAGRAFVVATGLGLPRTWGWTTRAALDGFAEGLASTGSAAERLDRAVAAARARLGRAVDALIERQLPDVAIVAVLLDSGALHAVACGAGRVYVFRRGQPPVRLTPREPEPTGLLRAQPARSSYVLEPDDLVLVGSPSAFSADAVTRLSQVLGADSAAPPAILASLLTDPAEQAGSGAASIALRVR